MSEWFVQRRGLANGVIFAGESTSLRDCLVKSKCTPHQEPRSEVSSSLLFFHSFYVGTAHHIHCEFSPSPSWCSSSLSYLSCEVDCRILESMVLQREMLVGRGQRIKFSGLSCWPTRSRGSHTLCLLSGFRVSFKNLGDVIRLAHCYCTGFASSLGLSDTQASLVISLLNGEFASRFV